MNGLAPSYTIAERDEIQQSFDLGASIKFAVPTLVLGSSSPRRARILDRAGIKYIKILGNVDEEQYHKKLRHDGVDLEYAKYFAETLAQSKQQPFTNRIINGAVVTADTIVFCKGRILGKPHTKEKCREQHRFISDSTMFAVTAIAVTYKGKTLAETRASKIQIAHLPDEVIEKICNEPETLECAGYRSNGAISKYIKIDDADQQNNAGFDVPTLLSIIEKLGFDKSVL